MQGLILASLPVVPLHPYRALSNLCASSPSLPPRWDPSRAGTPYEFVGTPDFAASAVLAGQRPGLRDDLEALGYTLLELALGDMPW